MSNRSRHRRTVSRRAVASCAQSAGRPGRFEVTLVKADLDPFTEAVGRVVIAGRRLDAAIGVLTAYALDDQSGRVMPGTLESLLRWWGDYIGRVSDHAARMRHQVAYETALELGRRRDDTINALGRTTVPATAVHGCSSGDSGNQTMTMTTHAVMDLRDLAAAMDAHVDVVRDLAEEVRDSGRI
jgi:hypothetical protein